MLRKIGTFAAKNVVWKVIKQGWNLFFFFFVKMGYDDNRIPSEIPITNSRPNNRSSFVLCILQVKIVKNCK